jgi:hypothetical protein
LVNWFRRLLGLAYVIRDRARRPRVARLICIAGVTFLRYARRTFTPPVAVLVARAGLPVWADRSGSLAGVPLTTCWPRRQKRPAAGNVISRRLVTTAAAYPAEAMTRAGFRRGSAGDSYLMPEPAVQVDVIAVDLAGGGINDVGVQGMPVVGGLRRAV